MDHSIQIDYLSRLIRVMKMDTRETADACDCKHLVSYPNR